MLSQVVVMKKGNMKRYIVDEKAAQKIFIITEREFFILIIYKF